MEIKITPITSSQDDAICKIIQSVGAEFGAIGEGFGPSDAEVQAMSEHYVLSEKSCYFVASVDGKSDGWLRDRTVQSIRATL